MRLHHVAPFALIGTLLLASSAEAQAVDSAARKGKKNDGAAERTPEPPSRFYDDETPVTLELRANLGVLRRDKQDGAPWRPATLTYPGKDGPVTTPIRARTRGIWRLKNCQFPPLRLDLARKQFRGTVLEGVNRPKLVSVCRDDATSDQYLLQELQLYRIYRLLTPIGHRARLARVTYSDSANGRAFMTRWAILLEEEQAMADRLGMAVVEQKGAKADDLHYETSAIMGLFQYLIANVDWSIGGLHNGELLVPKNPGDSTGFAHFPVPFDFDYSGAVNTSYAVPPPSLRMRTVRERLFRGLCVPPEVWPKTFALFNEKREAIRALYAPTDPVGRHLDRKVAQSTLDFFDEFYATINDPREAKMRVIDACLEGN